MNEKFLILYYKEHKWRYRIIHAESALKAEEWFRYSKFKTSNVEYFEVFVFTGISDYV